MNYRIGAIARASLFVGFIAFSVQTARAVETIYSSLPMPAPSSTHNQFVAAAQPTETSFLNAIGFKGTETFEEFTGTDLGYTPALGGSAPNSQSLTFGASGVTGTALFAGGVQFTGGLYSVNSVNSILEYPADTAGHPNSITFNQLLDSFGSYVIQSGDDASGDSLNLHFENTNSSTSKDVSIGLIGPTAGDNNLFYFGVTDPGFKFNKLSLQLTNNFDGILLDNITVGTVTAVPEPSSFVLLGSAVAMLGFIGRRKYLRRV